MTDSNSVENANAFCDLRRKAQREIRKDCNSHMENINDPDLDKSNTKFWGK